MAFYAPVTLLALLPTWLILVWIGYAGMFWAVGVPTWYQAFRDSGSSLLTLGFALVEGAAQTLLAFSEATVGLILIALLIAYLPTIYSAFQRREAAVNLLEVRAGKPPSAVEMIERYHRIHGLDRLDEQWQAWEAWFADIEESHTSLAALVFLPFAPAGSLLDHGGRRGAGRGGPVALSVGHPLHPRGGALHSRRFHCAAPDRRRLRYRLHPRTRTTPSSRSACGVMNSTRFAIAWRPRGRPSRPTASRPGAILPAGG